MNKFEFILLSLLTIFLAGCSDNDTPEIEEIPQVEMYSEEGVRLLKQYAIEVDSIVRIHKEAHYANQRKFDIYRVSTEIRTMDAVQVATVSSNNNPTSILVEYKNGLSLNCLVLGKDDEGIVGDGKRNNMECYHIQFEEEPIVVPLGKKAVIVAPFQEDFQEDFTSIQKSLESIGFSVEVYKNQEVTTDLYKGAFLKKYDVIYISSHGLDLHCLTKTEVSEKTGEKPNVIPIALKGKVYEADIFLGDSLDASFPNSFIYPDMPNGSTFIRAYTPNQYGGVINWSTLVNLKTSKETADEVFRYLCEGYELSDMRVTLCKEQKHSLREHKYNSQPFYLVP